MFRALLRSVPVQALLGGLIWAYMAIVSRTVRWQVEGDDIARALWESDKGFIAAAWHSRILLLPTGWTRLLRRWRPRAGPLAMLISMSADGGFVARACKHLGLAVVRGSRPNARKKDRDKGGTEALKEVSRLLGNGGAVCITPDGPRGPRQRASLGAIRIAQRARSPILVYALASAPSRRLDSWDRFMVPLPFGRGAIVFDGPFEMPREADPETLRLLLEERLNAAQARAETLVGLDITPPAPVAQVKTEGDVPAPRQAPARVSPREAGFAQGKPASLAE